MLILQIDASSGLCSVALSSDGKLLHMEINTEAFQHGRDINLLIEKLLKRCGFAFSQLQAVSVNKGPGSYTSLRIGMATAKGLCYGLNIPLLTPTGIEILVDYGLENYPDADYYIPMIDARRMEVYTCDPVSDIQSSILYRTEILSNDSYASRRKAKLCFIGDGVEKWKNIWPVENQWKGEQLEVNAGMMSGISFRFYNSNIISDLFKTTPLYIKKPNITKSKKEYFK